MLPSQLSTPPTPFADRENLEKELQDLEKNFGNLGGINQWHGHLSGSTYAESSTTGKKIL